MSGDAATVALFGVAGKRALITGGTSGIGRMIARGLAAAGMEVWLAARDGPTAAATAAGLEGGEAGRGIGADVTTAAGRAAIAAALAGRPLHVLVNNAGTNLDSPLDGTDGPQTFGTVVTLNLNAPFLMVQSMLPNLERAASADDPARVMNISSISGLVPDKLENYAYSASKSGLMTLTRHLGWALAKRHITCNAIAPGLFPSRLTEQFLNMSEGDPPPEGWASPVSQRAGRQDDIAGAVIYLSSRAGAWVSGAVLPVSGGISTL